MKNFLIDNVINLLKISRWMRPKLEGSAWKVTFPALVFCLLLDFVGGTFLGAYFDKIMVSYPIILVILPGVMGLRGNIYGALASRFTTALFLGEMKPSLRERKVHQGVVLGIVLTYLVLIVLWIVGFFKVRKNALDVLLILSASTIFVSILLSYATAMVSVLPFKKGLDPDAVASPVITSVADILTIPCMIMFILLFERYNYAFRLILITLIAIFVILLFKFGVERRVLFQLLPVLMILSLIESVSGSLLESYSELIHRAFIFSVIYPAILDSLGNYGCVIGSKTSTRLHLGEIERFLDYRTLRDIASLTTTSLPLCLIMYSLGYIVSLNLGRTVGIYYIFFVLYPTFAFVVMFLGYSLAFLSYKFGLDPDNVTVPTITTLADLIGTAFTIFTIFVSSW